MALSVRLGPPDAESCTQHVPWQTGPDAGWGACFARGGPSPLRAERC